MEYFFWEVDDKLLPALNINFKEEGFTKKEPFGIFSRFSENMQYPDFICGKTLFEHHFCVSDDLKNVVFAYADFENMPVFVNDRDKLEQKIYWRLNLEEVDCLEDEEVVKLDDAVILLKEVKDKYIFKIKHKKTEKLVSSIHLVENMLRKGLTYGIKFVKVKTK